INDLDTLIYGKLRVRVLFYRKTQRTPENPVLYALEVGNLSRVGAFESSKVSLVPFIKVPMNIFRGELTINYLIPSNFDKFSLRIYDINGRCIKDLSKLLLKGKEG
ncbi:hypothetical protein, partial [Escherichia coli]|uniref:hypothetical protein n=1 Tax=Escherichia coli TaxID=562 RepID=UPI001386F04C